MGGWAGGHSSTKAKQLVLGRLAGQLPLVSMDIVILNFCTLGQWRLQKFFCGGHRGGKCDSEGAKIRKFAENG